MALSFSYKEADMKLLVYYWRQDVYDLSLFVSRRTSVRLHTLLYVLSNLELETKPVLIFKLNGCLLNTIFESLHSFFWYISIFHDSTFRKFLEMPETNAFHIFFHAFQYLLIDFKNVFLIQWVEGNDIQITHHITNLHWIRFRSRKKHRLLLSEVSIPPGLSFVQSCLLR